MDTFKNGENVYDITIIIYVARYENETKNKIERMLIENYKTIYSFKGNNKQIEIPNYFYEYFMHLVK